MRVNIMAGKDKNDVWEGNNVTNMTKSNVKKIADELKKLLKKDEDIDTKIAVPNMDNKALTSIIKIIAGYTASSRTDKALNFLGVSGTMLYKVVGDKKGNADEKLNKLRKASYKAIKTSGNNTSDIKKLANLMIENSKDLGITGDAKKKFERRLEEIQNSNRKHDDSDKHNAFIEQLTQERKDKVAQMKQEDSEDMKMLQEEFGIQTEYEGEKQKKKIASQEEKEQKKARKRAQVIAQKAIRGIEDETLKEIQEMIYRE